MLTIFYSQSVSSNKCFFLDYLQYCYLSKTAQDCCTIVCTSNYTIYNALIASQGNADCISEILAKAKIQFELSSATESENMASNMVRYGTVLF